MLLLAWRHPPPVDGSGLAPKSVKNITAVKYYLGITAMILILCIDTASGMYSTRALAKTWTDSCVQTC